MTQFSSNSNSHKVIGANGVGDQNTTLPTTPDFGNGRYPKVGDRAVTPPPSKPATKAKDAQLYASDSGLHQKSRSVLIQRFLDLPIRNKQFLGLLTSEAISVIGMVGVGAFLIITTGQNQLINQAKSELVVTDANYRSKVNQLGFTFRAQSDNSIITSLAKAAAKGEAIKSDTKSQVRQILRNEVIGQNIEYATLVGKDLKIVVNANVDRTGDSFNPNNLVKESIEEKRQISSNEIVSWSELSKESPPLLTSLKQQDALIRYTVTPVKDPATGEVIGALVSGDIVNGKLPIVTDTVSAFGGGYSAVYERQPSGKFALSTALAQKPGIGLEEAKPDIPLPDPSILDAAIAAKGQPVTRQMQIEGQTYTMAAKTVYSYAGEPVALLVRGTPETSLNMLIRDNLLLQLAVTTLAIAANVLLAIALGRAIAKPIRKLQQTTQQFSEGDFQTRAEVLSADEVGQLSSAFNTMADKIETNIEEIRRKETLLAYEAELAQQARQEAEEARQQAEKLAEEQRQLKENLQRRALELLHEIDPVTQGDLTVEVKVTDDEIGTIADSYNTTVENLRKIVLQVQTAAAQVTEATVNNDIHIQELSEDASRQAIEIAAALERVREMTDATQEVAVNAEEAKAVVQQAAEVVEAGDEAMNRTVEGIRAIRATVAATAKKVKHLGESSQKISTVVELISTFAEQTKMLALNASIEAALAGEEGRGFAVVADEVRALARQSAEATEEIRKLVASIQAETNEVMSAMEAGTEQVVAGTKLVDETRQSLNKITTASSQISQLVSAIAQATVVQSHASEAVSQTMKEVAAISHKTSEEASQVSSSFEQLQEIAQTLQTGISRFKLS